MRIERQLIAQIDLAEELDEAFSLVYTLTEGRSAAVDVLREQYFDHVSTLVV